ncbi:MAG: TorF family putative porin [Pseudomonadota bacterium]
MDLRAVATISGLLLGGQAAQVFAADWSPSVSASLASDERRRGLSWSDGRPAASARVSLRPADGFDLSVAATTLRGSPRHDGASAGIDSAIVYRRDFGAFRADAQISHHAFLGHGGANYVEMGGGAGTTIGPVQFDLFGLYAPKQAAIGGDNLYLAASASLAVVGTPFTVGAQIGRSSGDSHDPLRSARLRPHGRYTDARLRIDYVRGPLTLGVDLTDTWHGRRIATGAIAADGGRRLAARFGFSL